MNKILTLQVQDRNKYLNVKCTFTFDKLLKHNAKYNKYWLDELTDYVISIEAFKLEDYNKWKSIQDNYKLDDDSIVCIDNKINWKPPKEYVEFINTIQNLYTFNDYHCVTYKSYFHKYKYFNKHIIPIEENRINSDVYKNGIYYFDECIEKNPITLGAIQYLGELKKSIPIETNESLIWLANLTETLKTLIRWYY